MEATQNVVHIDKFQAPNLVGIIAQALEQHIESIVSTKVHAMITDAIKENLIPKELSKSQISFVYANEADLLNMALFGFTAKEWRDNNSDKNGNVRDQATIEQLVVLSNLESINAVLINQGLSQSERLQQLNQIAFTQMKSLVANQQVKKLK